MNDIDEKFLNEASMKLLPVMKILIKLPTDKKLFFTFVEMVSALDNFNS